MFDIERRNKIISLLYDKRSLLVQDAADMFGVTRETIRRDLKLLESQGFIIRTHGGAVLSDDIKNEAPLNIREAINTAGKDTIGKCASKIINNGDTIILDASTSSLYVAKNIKSKKGLTVITNAERILLELSSCKDITLISTGGILRPTSLSYVGRAAENAISSYHADKLFLSCKGFSPKFGLTDSSEQESEIRKTMIKCSEKVIFLCDRTKFERIGYVKTARIEDIDVMITDAELPEGWEECLKNASVEWTCAT